MRRTETFREVIKVLRYKVGLVVCDLEEEEVAAGNSSIVAKQNKKLSQNLMLLEKVTRYLCKSKTTTTRKTQLWKVYVSLLMTKGYIRPITLPNVSKCRGISLCMIKRSSKVHRLESTPSNLLL